jgi:hypothetical protein
MSKRHWYMEFVPGEWLTDPAVSLLRPATRGIWIDAIAVMHQMEQCGQIVGTVADLSRLCRCTPQEMRAAIEDLKQRNAADVTESRPDGEMLHVTPRNGDVATVVTLVNRRMKRLWLERKSSANRVMRHRERKRNGESNGDVTVSETPPLNLNLNLNPKREDKSAAVAAGVPPPAAEPDPEFWADFPPRIKTPAVRAAWVAWCRHRRDSRNRITPTAARQQIGRLAEMGPDRAAAALLHSTANGYRGVFEPRDGGGANGGTVPPANGKSVDHWNPPPEGLDPDEVTRRHKAGGDIDPGEYGPNAAP